MNTGVLRSPTSRYNLLHTYVSGCDMFIYRDELEEIRFANLNLALNNYGKRNGIDFIKVDELKWMIKRHEKIVNIGFDKYEKANQTYEKNIAKTKIKMKEYQRARRLRLKHIKII